jgi:PilZ domain-containing protein
MLTVTTSRAQIAKRRSSRIALNTSVGVSGHDSQKCPFTMPARATNLNRHGAAIHLPRQLLVATTVMVRNARGTQVSARVVAQLAASQAISIYGIEFLQPDDTTNSFWGIAFPTIEGRAAGAQATEQGGIARRRRGMPYLQS